MTQLLTRIDVPADVPAPLKARYEENFQTMTKGTGRLMLFAGDQKVEHLNDDFYGTSAAARRSPRTTPTPSISFASRATASSAASPRNTG